MIHNLFDDEDSYVEKGVKEDELEKIFLKVKDCEAMLVEKEMTISFVDDGTNACQPLLDEIIEFLKLHFSCHSMAYRKWIKKIQKEAPHVYNLIKPHLNRHLL